MEENICQLTYNPETAKFGLMKDAKWIQPELADETMLEIKLIDSWQHCRLRFSLMVHLNHGWYLEDCATNLILNGLSCKAAL